MRGEEVEPYPGRTSCLCRLDYREARSDQRRESREGGGAEGAGLDTKEGPGDIVP